ncbi:MAG TPA: hemolysin family protein [Gemmatimonadales bacterium]|nr:hemolysin family protein [Gemmatimonadales bacterium]
MEPDRPSAVVGLAAVLLLVLANAFFVAAEFALVGARKTRLDEMARGGDGKARLARRAVQSLDRYISATQLGITLASLGLGWIGEPTVAGLIEGGFAWLPPRLAAFGTHATAVAIAFSIITVLHIVLGELVPKALALLHPEEVSRWVAAPIMAFGWVMAIPIGLLNGISNGVLRLIRVPRPTEHDRLHSPEEIRMLVEQSQEFGTLEQQDARLLEGVFEFTEKTAEEVMTPRTEIEALEAELDMRGAADRVAEARRSRYPVYTGSLDEIVGVVHAKDILSALRRAPDAPLRSIMRPPLFVPGTREVEDVLADMKRLKVHLALVLDEYGGTAGLVTMEDLLEEIVGPIFDEYDRPERVSTEPSGALLDGATPISEFNAEHDAALDDTDYTTIGGLVFGQLGRLPRAGDVVQLGDVRFEVVAMAGRRVDRVRLLAPEQAQQAPEG